MAKGADHAQATMLVGEVDMPAAYDSLQSLTRSWSRAASISASPLVAQDQQSLLLRYSQSRQRPSIASDSTITVGGRFSNDDAPQLDLWGGRLSSTTTENAHLAGIGDHSTSSEVKTTDATRPSPPSVDENTVLLTGLPRSICELDTKHSTFAQTVFNTMNLILGIGLLGFPLALKQAGLLLGLLLLTWSAVTTLWTARMIDKCLSHDSAIKSFADLAFAACGPRVMVAVMVLVAIELTAASVGQIILFADGAQIFFRGSSDVMWKVLCGVAFVPLSCAPLRFLGISSALSVFSVFAITGILIAVGLMRPVEPGSLHSPAHTSILPSVWAGMPSSIGMILSAWGGHTVFPELYHDMQKPKMFFRSVKASYAISFFTYLLVGILGYLMFGDNVKGPITSEIIFLKHTPRIIPVTLMVLVAFFPVAKVPLNILPVSTALQQLYDLHSANREKNENTSQRTKILKVALKPAIRTAIGISFVALAVFFPNFHEVMSVLGIVAGLMIAVILPAYFYLSVMKDQVSAMERFFCICAIVLSSILAAGGLAFNFAGFS